jgi:hypothetical protein
LQIPATRLTSQDVQDLRLEILEKTKKKNWTEPKRNERSEEDHLHPVIHCFTQNLCFQIAR